MRHVHWLASAIAWDGMLPIIVGLIPVLVRITMPRNDGAIVLSTIFLPIIAAVLRAALASWQLQRACGGAMPILRQAALACAILCLLLFEILVSSLIFAAAPPSVWIVAGG